MRKLLFKFKNWLEIDFHSNNDSQLNSNFTHIVKVDFHSRSDFHQISLNFVLSIQFQYNILNIYNSFTQKLSSNYIFSFRRIEEKLIFKRWISLKKFIENWTFKSCVLIGFYSKIKFHSESHLKSIKFYSKIKEEFS